VRRVQILLRTTLGFQTARDLAKAQGERGGNDLSGQILLSSPAIAVTPSLLFLKLARSGEKCIEI
jgi:hypothetical protein